MYALMDPKVLKAIIISYCFKPHRPLMANLRLFQSYKREYYMYALM